MEERGAPSVMSIRSKHSTCLRRTRSLRPLENQPTAPLVDELLAELSKFRVDGRTINARNVDEIYPGLDKLLLRCLQTGDSRQLDNRLKRNLKAEYLLITGKHITLSIFSHTEKILDRLVAMGATLDLQFYEPTFVEELDLLCKYGWNINNRLPSYNYQTAFSFLINRNPSVERTKLLVEHGARFDIQDSQGQTVLHHLCQSNVVDSVFQYLIDVAPDHCLNIRNNSAATPLDLLYFSTYEKPIWSNFQRLHLLLSRTESRLTRHGMREPNLLAKKQFKLFDIIATKEFLFKYRLRETFDSSVRPLAWSIFLFYDVLRACENSTNSSSKIESRLDRFLVALIENGEIPLNKLLFRSGSRLEQATQINSRAPTRNESENNNFLYQTNFIQNRLISLTMEKLTLKSLCRIKIKDKIQKFPNDVVKLNNLSKVLQSYLTFYNPFVKNQTATISI